MAGSSSPRLTVLGGPLAGTELAIDQPVDNVLIGSDASCRFRIDQPGVNPIHARLWVDAHGITIHDAGTPEGVYLNDDRVKGSATVRNGDILWLGAPGSENAVMIQCRVPARGTSPAAQPPPAVEGRHDDEPQETVSLRAEAPAPAYEELPATVAAPPDTQPAFAVVPESFVAESEDVNQTVVLATDLAAPFAATEFLPPADEQVKFVLDEAPPPPLPPPVFEDDVVIAPEPPFEPEPTLAMPPPAPPAAVRPAPPRPTVAPPPPAAAPSPPRTVSPRVAAVPRPAGARPAAVPHPPAKTPKKASGGGGLWIGLAAVALIVLGGGGWFAYRYFMAPPDSAPQPTAAGTSQPPVTIAQAPPPFPEPTVEAPSPTPPVEEAVTIVKPPSPAAGPSPAATPSAKPSATPKPAAPSAAPTPAAPSAEALRAQQVATLVGQADAALAARRYDEAAGLYQQALQLDPQNAPAAKGRTSAQAGAAAARRVFVAGRSVLTGAKADKKGLAGFDSEDVSLAKAPDYSGRVEFEFSPRSPRAGEGYDVKVFLVNDGKKPFKIASLSAVTTANGDKSGGTMAPTVKELATQQRAQVQQVTGVWREDFNAWSLEVVVTSGHGETVRNTLTWR